MTCRSVTSMLIMLFCKTVLSGESFWEHFDCSVCAGCDFVKAILVDVFAHLLTKFKWFFFFPFALRLQFWGAISGQSCWHSLLSQLSSHIYCLYFSKIQRGHEKIIYHYSMSGLTLIFTSYSHNIKEQFCRRRCQRQSSDSYCIFIPAVFTPYFLYRCCTTHL